MTNEIVEVRKIVKIMATKHHVVTVEILSNIIRQIKRMSPYSHIPEKTLLEKCNDYIGRTKLLTILAEEE